MGKLMFDEQKLKFTLKNTFPSEIENSFLLALKQSENYENEGS